jgi:hypothetical protein
LRQGHIGALQFVLNVGQLTGIKGGELGHDGCLGDGLRLHIRHIIRTASTPKNTALLPLYYTTFSLSFGGLFYDHVSHLSHI